MSVTKEQALAYINQCFGKDYLLDLIDGSGFEINEVYDRSGLQPFFPYVIRKGQRCPARDTLLQLSFGLGLPVTTANEMLSFFGYSELNDKIHRDAAIRTALERGIGLIQTQDFLLANNCMQLGATTDSHNR